MDDPIFYTKRARDGTRTRDPHLGKVVLHQLSHSRIVIFFLASRRKKIANLSQLRIGFNCSLLQSTTMVILKELSP